MADETLHMKIVDDNPSVVDKTGFITPEKPPLRKRIGAFLFKNYLPLALITLVFFGILVPVPGVAFSKISFHYVCIVGLFLHSGIKLRTGEIKESLRAWKSLILNFIIIMLLTPIIAAKLTSLLPFDNDDSDWTSSSRNSTNGSRLVNRTGEITRSAVLGPETFRAGIQLYFIVPCTISAGVVLVAQAGGNSTLALMTTIICNIMAVFIVPPMMKWLMSVQGVQIDVLNLLLKLVLTVLLPLLVGKGCRYIPKVKLFVKRFSDTLKLMSITLLVMIPWMKVSVSSQGGAFTTIPVTGMLAVLAWGLLLHLFFMVMNLALCRVLKIEAPATKCVVVLASQKSLTVAVTVMSLLPISGPRQGLMALPMILIHLGILVLDAVIVTLWHNWDVRKAKREEVILADKDCSEQRHSGSSIDDLSTVRNETFDMKLINSSHKENAGDHQELLVRD
ncbi:predicted protein [Nematostella vectensis]|uniref:Uncharacterized protein n=1 Tax=Nematostella vectensis TaxID=45351 RepID=A7RRB9_NEMVE|nr:predicted protein [Nematostella vectensis]|eukprot:XP_001637984.1 predicted protein [Nematostella vectensis]